MNSYLLPPQNGSLVSCTEYIKELETEAERFEELGISTTTTEMAKFSEKSEEKVIEHLLSALFTDGDLTAEQVGILQRILDSLQQKAERITEKISALRDILEASGGLDTEAEKTEAQDLLTVANCVSINIKLGE